MNTSNQFIIINKLENEIKDLYIASSQTLPFHGWHHIYFVYKNCVEFAIELEADVFLVSVAALTHDFNYLVAKQTTPNEGEVIRNELLKKSGLDEKTIAKINTIIIEADIVTRNDEISNEAKALSDADSLFKALPITPIVFASLYLKEQQTSIVNLAEKILKDQAILFEKEIFFYSKAANAYLDWAETNYKLWINVRKYYLDSKFSYFLNEFESMLCV
ncbi:MAG: HD domain-containing protein [Bacteroidota bacterium]